jgi:TonB family protein
LDKIEGPVLLVELEPWHQEFLRNLRDFVAGSRQPPLRLTSRPAPFWRDVFVSQPLPWERFAQSAAGHAFGIILLLGFSRLPWAQSPVAVRPQFDRSDVIYYSPSEYLPPLDTGGRHRARQRKGQSEYARQEIISVPADADNHTQTIVSPPQVKIDHDVALPNIVAWSRETPAVPMAATASPLSRLAKPLMPGPVVAPAPEVSAHSRSLANLTENVVAPAPEVARTSSRNLAAPQAAVVQPAPQLDNSLPTRAGEISIGNAAVVAPAPQLPVAAQRAYPNAGGAGAGSAAAAAAVVPPPPSAEQFGPGGAGGRVIALNLHPADVAPTSIPAGNRRGEFAATPQGRSGAPGTPDISGNGSSGSSAGSGNGESGNGTGRTNNGAPAGLHVGATTGGGTGFASPTTSAGRSDVNPDLLAKATPPRVSSMPARGATPVDASKASEIDKKVFGPRRFYSMRLNMPNLNSAGGSWVVRFAEVTNDRQSGELIAPLMVHKVDPAYPLELMRLNVRGTVTLRAVIQADGSVGNVQVLEGVDDRLDEYARQAVTRCQFMPGMKNGVAVALDAVIQIPFRPARSAF